MKKISLAIFNAYDFKITKIFDYMKIDKKAYSFNRGIVDMLIYNLYIINLKN